jgi:hypothetical protein
MSAQNSKEPSENMSVASLDRKVPNIDQTKPKFSSLGSVDFDLDNEFNNSPLSPASVPNKELKNKKAKNTPKKSKKTNSKNNKNKNKRKLRHSFNFNQNSLSG